MTRITNVNHLDRCQRTEIEVTSADDIDALARAGTPRRQTMTKTDLEALDGVPFSKGSRPWTVHFPELPR